MDKKSKIYAINRDGYSTTAPKKPGIHAGLREEKFGGIHGDEN
jgi:hypothetical protein